MRPRTPASRTTSAVPAAAAASKPTRAATRPSQTGRPASRCGPGRAEDWDRRYASTDRLWSGRANRFLAAEAGPLTPGRALDLACGEGGNAVWLAERGWQVVGVDFSAVALERAAASAAARGVDVEWIAADLVEWEPPPAAFDLVCVLYLHLREPDRRLVHGRAFAAVAPGGTLLVVGHDRENLDRGYGGPTNPDVLLTPEAVVSDLPAEAVVERAERVERPVALETGAVVAIDTLVRARRSAGAD